jgi:hypothetical protein
MHNVFVDLWSLLSPNAKYKILAPTRSIMKLLMYISLFLYFPFLKSQYLIFLKYRF